MLSIIFSILGMLLTIFIIVGIHEFSHFIVARLCGIKVLRFSIGFGKALYRRQDKKGTEYVLAAIPLGGYVKMLDETEGSVQAEEQHLAFNRQPLYKKIAVVIAGPLSNLVLAFVMYWLIFVIGFYSIFPVIGSVTPHSIADKAGLKNQDHILTIDHKPADSWVKIILHLMHFIGDNKKVELETKNSHSEHHERHTLDLSDWQMDGLKPDPLGSLGIKPYLPSSPPPTIGSLLPHSPALESRLIVGDTILSIGNTPITQWVDVTDAISKHPSQTLLFTVKRNTKTIAFPVKIGVKRDGLFNSYGYLGISPPIQSSQSSLLHYRQYGVFEAIPYAAQNTLDFTYLNFIMLYKMVTGKVSLKSLGGPITIFQGAGEALNTGIIPFLGFIAFISIAIGVINILPIPGLDGGHLLFYGIEYSMGRPLSQNAQTLFYRLGMIVLMVLIIQAIANDLMRL